MSESGAVNDDASESSSVGPLHSITSDFRTALDEFRENWQRELHVDNLPETREPSQVSLKPSDGEPNVEAHEAEDVLCELPTDAAQLQLTAEKLFSKAVELEQRGKVYDALPYYRKATQIEPAIEFKYYERQKQINLNQTDPQKQVSQSTAVKSIPQNADEEELIEDLFEKFQNDLCDTSYNGKLFLSTREAGVISTELHIADLPPEIILCILRWVVSAQLDMRSLEQCAAVCKGMFLCARDEELWRLACLKVWGHNTGTLDDPNDKIIQRETSYYTWRQMFLLRERVHFNGCYISKTTYLRMGENSFQDQYYRPVQLVEYYRYIRFLSDGKCLMMTSADEPAQGVTKLKQLQNLRPEVLRGRYRLFGNTITLVMQKQQNHQPVGHVRQRRGSFLNTLDDAINVTQYAIEFHIVHAPKRRFGQLIWQHYSIMQKRNKVESSSEFDIVPTKYPPLWFSPVRSYHLVSDSPLA